MTLRLAELKFLERVFASEIAGGMLQSKSKMAKKLEALGYIREVDKHFSSALGAIVCKGYILTILGNATYCMSDLCSNFPEDTENG